MNNGTMRMTIAKPMARAKAAKATGLELSLSHGEKLVTTKLMAISRMGGVDPLRMVNEYLDTQSELSRVRYFDIVVGFHQALVTGPMTDDEFEAEFIGAVNKTAELFNVESVSAFISNNVAIPIDSLVEVFEFDPDSPNTEVKTYTLQEYYDLVTLSFMMKLSLPFICMSYAAQKVTRETLVEHYIFECMERTTVFDLPAVERLRIYFAAYAANIPDAAFLTAVMSGYDAGLRLEMLLAAQFIKRVPLLVFIRKDTGVPDHVVTHLMRSIGQALGNESRPTAVSTAVRIRRPPGENDGGDSEQQSSVLEVVRHVPPMTIPLLTGEINAHLRDRRYISRSFGLSLTDEELTDIVTGSRELSSTAIPQSIINIGTWFVNLDFFPLAVLDLVDNKVVAEYLFTLSWWLRKNNLPLAALLVCATNTVPASVVTNIAVSRRMAANVELDHGIGMTNGGGKNLIAHAIEECHLLSREPWYPHIPLWYSDKYFSGEQTEIITLAPLVSELTMAVNLWNRLV